MDVQAQPQRSAAASGNVATAAAAEAALSALASSAVGVPTHNPSSPEIEALPGKAVPQARSPAKPSKPAGTHDRPVSGKRTPKASPTTRRRGSRAAPTIGAARNLFGKGFEPAVTPTEGRMSTTSGLRASDPQPMEEYKIIGPTLGLIKGRRTFVMVLAMGICLSIVVVMRFVTDSSVRLLSPS